MDQTAETAWGPVRGETPAAKSIGSAMVSHRRALLFPLKPAYTSFALRAKIQGSVLLEAVVQRDGTTRDIRVSRSLDRSGLDVEAIHALEQWRFRPGRFNGAPVDVRVLGQLDFNIQ